MQRPGAVQNQAAATTWEVDFLCQMEGAPDMTLGSSYELYRKDMDKKLCNTTRANRGT